MDSKSDIMKNEIRHISRYRALTVSKYYLCLVLAIISVYLGIYNFPSTPSLSILFILAILPPILAFIIKDYAQKSKNKFIKNISQESSFLLSTLKKKYKYSKINYFTNSITYLICILLICIWHISFKRINYINETLEKLPVLTLITGLTLRYVLVIVYRIKLPFNLMRNKI